MIIQLTSYTLPDVSAKVVMLNWINHSKEEEYQKRLRRCEVPVLDYMDKWKDYNKPDSRDTILCLENLSDPVLDMFKTQCDELIEAYSNNDRVAVISILAKMCSKNIDLDTIKSKLKRHDKRAYEKFCKKENMAIDLSKFEDWYRLQQEYRRDLKEEDNDDILNGI